MRLFLGSLPYTVLGSPGNPEMVPVTETLLQAWIERWGIMVLSLTLKIPETGAPYAFVNVPKEQGPKAIAMLDKKLLGGKTITVREARSKP